MPDANKIEKSLRKHNISEALIETIMAGKENLTAKSNKKEKAIHLINVINRIDSYLDEKERSEIMDWCACCKGGQRDKDCKQYAMKSVGQPLEQKIRGLSSVKYMGRPRLNDDGTISTWIYWKENEKFKCACTNFKGLELNKAVSTTYCLCCAGHFRYHYQNALGVKLRTIEVVSSVLSSKGEKPCEFVYEIIE